MTTGPERVTVQCPSCGVHFETWGRASANLDPDDFEGAPVEEPSTATCPACGAISELDAMVAEDGVFHFPNE